MFPGCKKGLDVVDKGIRDFYCLFCVMSADEKEIILTILNQLSRKPLFGFRVSEYSRIEPGSIKICAVPAEVPVEDRIHLLDSSEVMSPVVKANFL